jgi:CRP-like cAMP-binding protein
VKFWIDDPSSHLKIEHAVRTNIWYRLKEKGFGIPNPIRTVEYMSLEKKQKKQTQSYSQQRYDAVKDLWMFQPLSEEEKRSLADGAEDVLLYDGQVLFRQDDPGESLYIIRKGQVDVLIRQANGGETKVATLKSGDFFGEMSALTGQPRTATIRATGDLVCVKIGKEDLNRLFNSDPAIMEKISQIVAQRNAQREAKSKEANAAPPSDDAVKDQQKSLFGKMLRFFGRGG